MKYIRKSIAVVLITVIIFLLTFNTAAADSGIIYQTSTGQQGIASGVTLENIVRFTNDGWLNINVLRVDLSDPYVKIDTMTNANSIKSLTSVKSMAGLNGAIAAINGGFFNWMKDSGSGYPDGPVVQSENIITASSAYNMYNDSMASISIDKLNQVLYNYWKTDITLLAPNGNSTGVGQYNKTSGFDYADFTILDRKWANTSIGADAARPDIVEMVVDGGKVTEIRESQPAASIPQNGYVVVTRQVGGQFIKSNFKVGDNVAMSITTTPDWNKLKMAITGGAILVKDGQIPAVFSNNITGRQPRTAIGSTSDGKKLLLVTVDGRQNSSIGMTQTELANFMLSIGAYNALNLDGGGSTTMVARTPGTNNIDIVNSPSDGFPRGVATAVGIFSIAPPSALDGMIIDTDDTNVFVNTSRSFTIRGYDRYFNPIDIDQNDIHWSVSGVTGNFKGNTFYPSSVGTGKIKATVNGVSSELEISVLSSPVQLQLNKKQIQLPLNGSQGFTVSGKNRNGYHAYINPSDVSWTVKGNIGKFSNDTFTATNQGTGYIDASIGSTHAYCAVSIASSSSVLKDGFEADNGSFLAYPTNLTGNYMISNEQKHSGKTSGKLIYDFTNTEGTRAAYMVFYNNGLQLSPNTVKIGLWVYNTHQVSNWLRAEVADSNGKKHLVDLAKNMDWTGWKYVEASLDGINSPASLTRLYLVQTSPVSDTGYIYMDDLTAVVSSYPSAGNVGVPQDTVPVDDANRSVSYQKGSDSFRFGVFGQSRDAKNPLETLMLLRLTDKINTYIDAAAVVGNNSHDFMKYIKVPSIKTNTGYKSFDMKGSRFIQLDVSGLGLRSGNPGQWQWFMQQLNSFSGSNVFIFLANSHLTFSDLQEAGLFQKVLTDCRQKTGKTVWVFYKGSSNSSYMERGIKYISAAGYDMDGITPKNTDPAKYILVTVQGSSVTYEIKPVVQ